MNVRLTYRFLLAAASFIIVLGVVLAAGLVAFDSTAWPSPELECSRLRRLGDLLERYKTANAEYPLSLEDLEAWAKASHLLNENLRRSRKITRSAYGDPYFYRIKSGKPEIKSLGPDGQEGGASRDLTWPGEPYELKLAVASAYVERGYFGRDLVCGIIAGAAAALLWCLPARKAKPSDVPARPIWVQLLRGAAFTALIALGAVFLTYVKIISQHH